MTYVLAGYRVASREARPDWQEAGLPNTELVSMSDCVVDLLTVDSQEWNDWFGDVESARVQANRAGLHVLGVGIAESDIPAFGLPERRTSIPDGQLLGFELVGHDCGTWHTWTCLGGLVRDVEQATGVRPGQWGLIQDERQARRAADWLTASNLGDPKVFHWVAAMLFAV
ncbi:hypothetical protein LWC34_43010 [Kibdelosporangium philippinense]|uniref:Uncharacterized protein n=1 Tax=Kibdelosporangium philippinense TaxID=211113 RepID=A0ABS8ZPM8_9PSEU|nr:hypothetical protein [Kibdelosporangium philippinense]MCE7009534.1 hypothetical protein [Kibdelosporangium philippinense]